MSPQEISLTALDVEWQRLQVIAQNLANANAVLGPGERGYRPLQLVSGPKVSFDKVVRADGALDAQALQGVAVLGVEPENVSPRQVYEPSNSQADKNGYVTYSGVDHASEMTLMIRTSRIYEANLVALNTARQMYAKALEIGKRG